MVEVDMWTSAHAMALRRALDLDLTQFARKVHVSYTTVRTWNERGDIKLRAETCPVLDQLLAQAPPDVQSDFCRRAGITPPEPEPAPHVRAATAPSPALLGWVNPPSAGNTARDMDLSRRRMLAGLG